MLRIDRRLINRILDETPANEAIYGISQYLGPRDREDPEFGLTRPEMNLRLFLYDVGEVGNGGHVQYFLNPIGGYSARALAALQEIGLDALSGILSEASSVFAGGLVPSSQDEREIVIEALPPEVFSVWERLDRRIWSREDSTADRVLRYLRDNRDQILRPETA